MCRCLKVSPSGYYAWRSRPESRRARSNRQLLERIREIHRENDGVVGSPRVCRELHYEGVKCSRNRVARLMRSAGLRGIPQRRRWCSKVSSERPGDVENLLQRDFEAAQPNTKWT